MGKGSLLLACDGWTHSEKRTLIKTQDSSIPMKNTLVSLRQSPVSGRHGSRAILRAIDCTLTAHSKVLNAGDNWYNHYSCLSKHISSYLIQRQRVVIL